MLDAAEYISFEDGRCRRLKAKTSGTKQEEAIYVCEATNCEANLLDERLTVVARVRREQTALNGFVVEKAHA